MSQAPGKSPHAFRTISEVAELLDVQQHVLRFWETKFPAIKPLKRGGNRRYYRAEDVALLRAINRLLYTEGYTIRGVQKLLEEHGPSALASRFGSESDGQREQAHPPSESLGLAGDPGGARREAEGAHEPGTTPPTALPDPPVLTPAQTSELAAIRDLLADGLRSA